ILLQSDVVGRDVIELSVFIEHLRSASSQIENLLGSALAWIAVFYQKCNRLVVVLLIDVFAARYKRATESESIRAILRRKGIVLVRSGEIRMFVRDRHRERYGLPQQIVGFCVEGFSQLLPPLSQLLRVRIFLPLPLRKQGSVAWRSEQVLPRMFELNPLLYRSDKAAQDEVFLRRGDSTSVQVGGKHELQSSYPRSPSTAR